MASKVIGFFLTLCLCILTTACHKKESAEFQTISSFAEIEMTTIDKDTLVVLDADETLIQPTDTYMINEHTEKAKAFREKILKQNPHIRDNIDLLSIILLQAQRPLIDPKAIGFVKSLHSKGSPVIVCTGMNTGKYGRVPRLEAWRYEHLSALGIELSFPEHDISFEGFKGHPVFYKGVLATDLGDKGPILTAFLSHMKLTPRSIIMVDDKPGDLASVQKACEHLGIIFKGYLFKGAKTRPWNEPLAQFQADHLIQHKQWLSDEEAIPLLKEKGMIIPTSSMETIRNITDTANDKTLIIFDVDDVLLQAKDQILQKAYKHDLEKLEKVMESRMRQADANVLYSTIFLERKDEVIDQAMVTLIQDLQKKGIRALVLTNCGTGPFGKIESMEDWRINELKTLGYHFEKSWSGVKAITLIQSGSQPPSIFKEGVIFASNASKGDALEAFSKQVSFPFNTVIFLDDKRKNLESVRAFCQKAGLTFIGIEYTAVKERPAPPLNKERAELQLKILEEEKRWLSDEEASAMMTSTDWKDTEVPHKETRHG